MSTIELRPSSDQVYLLTPAAATTTVTLPLPLLHSVHCVLLRAVFSRQNGTAAAAAAAEGEGGGLYQDNPCSESLGHTLSWLRRAVELDPSSYDAWHAWALMNYQLTEVLYCPLYVGGDDNPTTGGEAGCCIPWWRFLQLIRLP